MIISHIPLKKKLALELFNRLRRNESKLHQLTYIFWECTLRCNLRCMHCGSDCRKEARIKDMPVDDFIRAIEQVRGIVDPHNTTIAITGGEALLRNDLEQAGRKLYMMGFPWGIVTNGMLLDGKRLESLLSAGLRSITVSLDGLSGTHNKLRGNRESFDRALHAIRLAAHVPDLAFDVVSCIHPGNFHELIALKDLLIENGVKSWRIFTVFPTGRAVLHKELQLSPGEFKTLFDFIRYTRSENRIDLSYGCEGFLGNYEHEVRDHFFLCRAGINVASILADGSISACPDLRGNFIQGNIYTDNFADVWQNRYQVFRDKSWTKTGICADCEFYKYCEGNGMHLRDEKTGELMLCHLKKMEEGNL